MPRAPIVRPADPPSPRLWRARHPTPPSFTVGGRAHAPGPPPARGGRRPPTGQTRPPLRDAGRGGAPRTDRGASAVVGTPRIAREDRRERPFVAQLCPPYRAASISSERSLGGR